MEDVHKAVLAAALSHLVSPGEAREIDAFEVARSPDGATIAVAKRHQRLFTVTVPAVEEKTVEVAERMR